MDVRQKTDAIHTQSNFIRLHFKEITENKSYEKRLLDCMVLEKQVNRQQL